MNTSAIIDLSDNPICSSYTTSRSILHEIPSCDGNITTIGSNYFWCTKWLVDANSAEANATLYSTYDNYFAENLDSSSIFSNLKAALVKRVDFTTCNFN
jgi:hypothetical protein